MTTNVYAVGEFTDFVLSTGFYTGLSGPTTPLVDGNRYQVVVSATDGTNVVGVYIPTLFETMFGFGWTQIKHLPGGSSSWFPGDDNLIGYGGTEFLFTTGDYSRWLICDQSEVNGENYSNADRIIKRSSINESSYTAKWYNRDDSAHDPIVSLQDRGTSLGNNTLLYAENSFVNDTTSIHVSGMYVYKR